MEEYFSHYRKEDDCYQTNQQHQENTAALCQKYCQVSLLKKAAYITGLHHDDGKNTSKWQSYFQEKIQREGCFTTEKIDHSTLGGLIVETYAPRSMLSEMIQMAIFTHHGMADSVSAAEGVSLQEKRRRKYDDTEIECVKESCERKIQEDWPKLIWEAKCDLNSLLKKCKQLPAAEDGKKRFGNKDFYLGMCERLLFSVLADSDIRDTVDFMENRRTSVEMTDQEIKAVWKSGIEKLEKKLEDIRKKQLETGSDALSKVRNDISEKCEKAAYSAGRRYRLAVPTGAGKTLSSLRFGFRKAYEEGKRHIFYVAPFRSILEQNTDEIRDVMQVPEWVLEHHGDVVLETEQENWRYERLIENWDEIPIIATTAVQFFNTLFKEKKRNIRRFHSLCNSIIIFDEIQALPAKVLGLFDLAINFLTEICGSVVVLCTATQPLLEELPENRMLRSELMTEPFSVYEPLFRRVEYHDAAGDGKAGFGIEEAAGFIYEKAEAEEQVLAIFNTRNAARKVFESLKKQNVKNLFHLSTSMCAEHRRDTLKEIKKLLESKERVVCISTQLVEAGVDFSFRCVVRSLAGLDNLIQAAGRCNRNGGTSLGHVYVIHMDPKAENLSHLPDIQKAQDAMRKILRIYQEDPDVLRGRLDSEEAVQAYYREYLVGKISELKYPVSVDGIGTDLISLLSDNREFAGDIKGIRLKQAFSTAGKKFALIEESEGISVVVPYKNSEDILKELSGETAQNEQKRLLRKLQRYTVVLSQNFLKRLEKNAVIQWNETVFFLDERYYDKETGVREEPGEMKFLDF